MQTFRHSAATIKILAETLRAVPDEPDPLVSARSLSRATTIVGLMLEDLGDNRGGLKKIGGIFTRFGQVAWGLVELAAPRSLGQILFQYWIAIAYALAVLMVLMGVLTGAGGVTRAGYLVLGVTIFVNIAVEKLRRWMVTKDLRQLKPMWLLIPLLIAVLGGAGLYSLMTSLDTQMAQNGAQYPDMSGHAGELTTPKQVTPLLAPATGKYRDANITLMIASLGWDSLFIVCYASAFLLLGWINATQFDRPYRAFAWVLLFTSIAVVCDAAENLQAYFALRNITAFAPIYTSGLKILAGEITIGILFLQAILVWLDRASSRYRTLGTRA